MDVALKLKMNVGRDYGNALFLATACDLAYYTEAEGKTKFAEQLGLDAKLISVDNTQAYVGQNAEHIVVAFRGSESPTSFDGLKDWLLTNAKNFLVLPEGEIGIDFASAGVGARFHRGFMEALAEIWDPLYAAVNTLVEESERPVWVTGHSLGGALALLAGWRFLRQYISVHQIYTFGAPMIGNEAAAKAFHREFPGKIFRFVDTRDLVPKLPTVSLMANEYEHCLEEVAITAEGETADQSLKKLADQEAGGSFTSQLMDAVWGNFKNGIAAHLMTNYLGQIGKQS